MEVCEDKPERGKRCLQQRRESGRDVLLSPKHETVVESERQDSSDGEKKPISAGARQLQSAYANYRKDNRTRNHEPDARESQWRQVFKTKLDEEPGRAPDSTQH